MPSSHRLPAPAPSYLECPRCPRCQARMTLESISPALSGYQVRTFECDRCGRLSAKLVPSDPMKNGELLQYLRGQLTPPK